MADVYQTLYNPDVLSCLANLSNDEVFTPPEVANRMLDLLPQELFRSPDTTFLDPACKSGVFLREIAKRLLVGLEDQIPDLQQRIDHIFQKQLYGIAITELTSLLSRRSVYCSKYPNSKYSVSHFDSPSGNILYKRIQHRWQNEKCVFCGASQSEYERGDDLETHAYEFIHTTRPEDIFKMKFDVIIGNPPYHMSTVGGENGAQAKPLYHLFCEKARKLNPRYLIMIIPSRWFAGGWGLDDFRNSMMDDPHLREIHDFPNASDCFPGVEIKGGVCYFLRDSNYNENPLFVTHEGTQIKSQAYRALREGQCDVVIRYNEAIPILHKITSAGEKTFDELVSTKKPFGFTTNYHGREKNFTGSVKIYANRRIEYAKLEDVSRRRDEVNQYKVIVPKAVGSGDGKTDIIKPILCRPGECCTETYLLIGPFENEQICENVIGYIGTRFFHFLITLQKNTQDCMKKVYSFVPVQDFTEKWTDEKLYEKYKLTAEEIDYIEKTVWPMELGGDD